MTLVPLSNDSGRFQEEKETRDDSDTFPSTNTRASGVGNPYGEYRWPA